MSEKQINIKEKTYQSVWLTINIQEIAEAFSYIRKVTVKSIQGDQSLPIYLTMYPLTLPSDRHLKVIEWYSTSRFAELHGIKEMYSEVWFALLKTSAENMLSHRQNIFQVPMDAIEIRKSKITELEFDFTQFDPIAQVFWNTGNMDFMEIGELIKFGSKDWSDTYFLVKQDFISK